MTKQQNPNVVNKNKTYAEGRETAIQFVCPLVAPTNEKNACATATQRANMTAKCPISGIKNYHLSNTKISSFYIRAHSASILIFRALSSASAASGGM